MPDPAAPRRHPGRPGRRRRVAGLGTTTAVLLVWLSLTVPDRPAQVSSPAYLRMPLEGIVLVLLLLLAPVRARRVLAVAIGVVLALLVGLRLLDLGLYAGTGHPFDVLTDWGYVGSARGLLADAVGPAWAWVVVAGVVLVLVALLVALPVAVRRLGRAVEARPRAWLVGTAALSALWLATAVSGAGPDGQSLAASPAAGLVVAHVEQVGADRADRAAFARQASVDPYGDVPARDLLTGLRGKDVVVVFVESYGRVALDGPSTVTAPVSAALASAGRRLAGAGWSSRSGWLTSPTYGGLSWLAHSTLQSGLWVDDQQRYDDLVAGDRLTLSGAFRGAGWRTVSVVPSDHGAWWVGRRFYGFDAMYDADTLGYTGPSFGYADVPDELTLARLAASELRPGRRTPVMAEVDLVSSHGPWTPIPRLLPWSSATDSTRYAGMPAGQPSAAGIWSDPRAVQAAYGRSVAYALGSLTAFVENARDDDLVLVVLGDHQPASIVSGRDSDHDVPVSIVAHDPAVMRRLQGWGWQDGLRPGAAAPLWPMDAFRDRFLAAFG